MSIFIVAFVALYGALCLYTLRWLKPAFAWKRTGMLGFALFALVMLAASIFSHVLDRGDHTAWARIAGLSGHLWMLLIMWIVSFGLVADIWNILMFIASRFRPTVRSAGLSPHRFVSVMGVVAAVLSVWGLIEANTLRLETISRTDEQSLLRFEFLRDFTILLKHQPIVSPKSAGLFNLQLSGHTHGGQVFPFHFWVRLFYPRLSGLYDLGNDSKLYVSPGVGTWGPPIRVLTPPRVTLFDIHPATGAPAHE